MSGTTLSKVLEIRNRLGLHARAAAQLVKTASGFAARITVTRDEQEVDAKSILSLMTLAAGPGTRIRVTVCGDDAAAALAAIEDLIARRFGEE
jgi:phosphocarrier protein